jgi:cell division septum initiation protein DivIVA
MSETRDTLPTSGDAFPAATSTPTGSLGATGSAGPTDTRSGGLDTAKREAGNVVDTAKDQAAGVVETAKEEAKGVGREARAQAARLYDNARQELRSQVSPRVARTSTRAWRPMSFARSRIGSMERPPGSAPGIPAQ